MKQHTARRSSLFLLEIIIALFFFCVASMLCLRLFARAHVVTQETQELDRAVNATASVAELFQKDDDPLAYLQSQYTYTKLSNSGETLTLFYDAEWKPCSEELSAYQIEVETVVQSRLITANILARTAAGKPIYSLETNRLIQGGGGL